MATTMVGEMAVRFTANVENLTAGVQKVQDSVQKTAAAAKTHIEDSFVSSMKSGLSSILEFGAHAYQSFLGVQMVIQQVTGVVGGWVKSAEDAIANQKQLNAVLASTHDAVGLTADQINQMVQHLKNLDGIDDDVILSGENMLLTFTNIGGSVLPQASQAMLDMAVKMNNGSLAGLDLKDTAIQLGKALNDPINGITALSRVGVTFTDQQKAQIKAMMDAGNTAGAQAIILNELEREFGGSAQAAGNVDPFNRFQLAMGDIGKAIGGILLPPLTALANMITPLANDFLDWMSHLSDSGGLFSQLGTIWNNVVLPPLQEIGRIINVDTKPGLDALGDAASKIIAPFQHLSDIHVNWRPVLNEINNLVWEGTQAFNALAGGVDAVVTGLTQGQGPFGFLQGVAQTVAGDLNQVGQALAPLGGLFGDLVAQLQNGALSSFQSQLADWAPIIQQVAAWFQNSMLPALVQIAPPAERLIGVIINQGVPAFFAVKDAVSHVASVIATTLLPIWEKMEPILARLVGWLLDMGQKALAFLLPKVEDAAKAVSTFADELSTRLAPFIQHVTEGIQQGAAIISAVWNALWPTISQVLKYTWDIISGVIKTAWDIITGLFKIGADILSGNWGQLWDDVKGLVVSVWDDIKGIVGTWWDDLNGIFKAANNVVGKYFNQWIMQPIKDAVSGAIDWIKGVWQAFINWLTGTGHSSAPSVGGGHAGGIGPQAMQHFAGGGVMPYSGLATVGENGPEILALPAGARVYNNSIYTLLSSMLTTEMQLANLIPVSAAGGVPALQSGASSISSGSGGGTGEMQVVIEIPEQAMYMDGQKVGNIAGQHIVARLRNSGIRVA